MSETFQMTKTLETTDSPQISEPCIELSAQQRLSLEACLLLLFRTKIEGANKQGFTELCKLDMKVLLP